METEPRLEETDEEDVLKELERQKMVKENKLILEKLKDQNSKLERMFLYLRECNSNGLGYNQENYLKRKSKVLNTKIRKVVKKISTKN